jgi:betaine-aldehyde dehydrogenase
MKATEPLLIGDRWLQGRAEPILSVNPANGEVNAAVSAASVDDLDLAVRTAQQAYEASGWKELLPHQRADRLHRAAQLFQQRAEVIATVVMRENGKTYRECHKQVLAGAAIFRYFASVCETMESEVTPPRGDYLTFTVYEPHGVVAAITPWNSPINTAAEKVAPALAAGNAVILKPSEVTPMAGLEVGKVLADSGLPAGIFNVLPATADVSAALVKHPGVAMISFTGGTRAGLSIAAAAAERFAPTLLELGGKSPHIVFEDCDVERAAAGVAFGIFSSMGQTCIAGSRLFVHRAVHKTIVDRVVSIAESLRLGLPEDEKTQFGPLASFAHRDRVSQLVDAARREGARLLTGGARPAGELYSRGAYYLPTVIDGVHNDSAICQTEIFGPVLCVLPFEDEETLVREANDTVFGLACGIWTKDFARAWRVARRVQAGTVWVNTYRQNSATTPFGGYKQSGLGRERGCQALRQYQQVKSVFVSTSDRAMTLD